MKTFILICLTGAMFATWSFASTLNTESSSRVDKRAKALNHKRTLKRKAAHLKKGKRLDLKAVNTKGHELQTDVRFNDSVLHGQYQTPDEALARVENEKAMTELLGIRKNFKDRLATASETE